MAVRNNSDALNELVNGVNGAEGLQSKIDKKAPLNSPTLTGTPTAPTPAKNVSGSDRLATTAYVLSLLKNNPEIIDDIQEALKNVASKSGWTSETGFSVTAPNIQFNGNYGTRPQYIRMVGDGNFSLGVNDPNGPNQIGFDLSYYPNADTTLSELNIRTGYGKIKLQGEGLYFNGTKIA